MAKFEGVKWAPRQMRYLLSEKRFEMVDADAKVFAVSRSVHYGLFLAFVSIARRTREGRRKSFSSTGTRIWKGFSGEFPSISAAISKSLCRESKKWSTFLSVSTSATRP